MNARLRHLPSSARRRLCRVGLLLTIGMPMAAAAARSEAVVTTSVSAQAWRLKSPDGAVQTRLEQFAVPVVASVPLGAGLDVVLTSAYGASRLRASSDPEVTLSGSMSITGELFWRSPGRHLLVELGGAPEGGRRALTVDEYPLLQWVRQPTLGFELPHYGQGAVASASITWVREPSDRFQWSLGIGGVKRQPYLLVTDEGEYRPASELSATLGLGLSRVRAGAPPARAQIDATVRLLGPDRIAGTTIYHERTVGDVRVTLAIPTESGIWEVDGRAIAGAGAEMFSTIFPDAPPDRVHSTYRGVFRLSYEREFARRGTIGGYSEGRLVGGSDELFQRGWTLDVGPSLGWTLWPGWSVRANGMLGVGGLRGGDGWPESRASGGGITLALVATGGHER